MSIFNPYVLLGIILAVLGAFGGGYYKGGHDEVTRQQLEIAKLNAEARQKEQSVDCRSKCPSHPTSKGKPKCKTFTAKAQC
jgi:hypothetical protein